ncbi:hypothetical protein [Methylobacterium fujisawaense]|uniref:hypothetical protein n=1 Tax=Methylobacterium fujisawaense TaxID=107400 RepID=UPI00313C03BC
MSALSAVVLALFAAALAAFVVANLLARRGYRRLIASYKALVSAKDEQIHAYAGLIAEQEACIVAQRQLIRAHETRAAVLGLLPGGHDASGAPLQ